MERLAAIHEALLDAGFTSQFQGGRNRYFGNLHCRGTDYPVWVEIPDPELVDHPLICLVERPQGLPEICAHVGATGYICYSTEGVDVLDIYNPGAQIFGCLSAAENVLCEALHSDTLNDIQAEFHSHWKAESMLLADLKPDAPNGWLNVYEMTRPNGEYAFRLAADSPEALKRSGYISKSLTSRAYVISLEQRPSARSVDWPPDTLGQLVTWLKSMEDGRPYKAFTTALRERHDTGGGLVLLARTPGSWWAALIHEDRLAKKAHHQNTSRWTKYVLQAGSRWEITRLLVERVDADHLINRNLAERTGLGGKRILLIGCGTIGGYLADLLSRSGAGSSGGKLVLCDNQKLLPGNIGRHYLGVEHLLELKALAVASRLSAALPYAQLEGIADDARKIGLKGYDCIIDATGNEAFSLTLNDQLLKMGDAPPVLYVWNEGGGVASQCLLVDSPKAACYRCLCDENRRPRFSPLNDPEKDAFIMGTGCDAAFVPYPAVVSVQAAGMAGKLLLDWVNGQQVKRLQTIIHDPRQGRVRGHTSPTKHSRCPACSK